VFSKSADIYDAIYLGMGKDYAAEARKIDRLVRRYKRTAGIRLLDAACGTGLHIEHLRRHYQVEGLDIDAAMLRAARRRNPEVPFRQANLLTFKYRRRFDIITCLFSAIGYVKTTARLSQAVQNMSAHLQAGAVLILEPWFTPSDWEVGDVHAVFVDEPQRKIARMSLSRIEGVISYLDFYYLLAEPHGVRYFKETHALGLFSDRDYRQALASADLRVVHDREGVDGRGLYIGIKPDA